MVSILTLYATSFMVETFFLSLGMLKEGVSCLFIFFQVSPFRSARPNWFRFGGVNPWQMIFISVARGGIAGMIT